MHAQITQPASRPGMCSYGKSSPKAPLRFGYLMCCRVPLHMKRESQACAAGVAGPLYPSPQSLDADHPLSLAQREDLKAAGLTLLETVICALAEGGPSCATSSDALQRLLCDVFQMDVQAFRWLPRSSWHSQGQALHSAVHSIELRPDERRITAWQLERWP